jgi:hypothetical protein
MRRSILALLGLTAGFAASGAFVPVPAATPAGRPAWNLGRNGMAVVENGGLVINDTSDKEGGFVSSPALAVVPGTSYAVRGSFQSSSPSARAALGGLSLDFFDGDGKALPGKNTFQIPADSQGAQPFRLTAEAPAGAKTMRIVLRSYANPVCRIELSGVEWSVADAAAEEPATSTAAPAPAANRIPVLTPAGRPAWNLGRMAAVEVATLVIDDVSPEQGGVLSSPGRPVEPGARLVLRCKVKSSSATSRSTLGGVGLEFYDGDGKALPDKNTFAVPYDTKGVCEVTVAALAPAGAKTVRVVMRSYASPTGRIELSDVELAVADEAEFERARRWTPDFGQDFPPPSPAAIRALAAQLPDGPFQPVPVIGDRVFWTRAATVFPRRAEVIELAEQAMKEPVEVVDRLFYLSFYERKDGVYEYRAIFHRRSERLSVLALAECLENQGRFLPAIQGLAESMLREPTWVLPHHDKDQLNISGRAVTVDLGSSGRGALLMTVRRIFADVLPPELTASIDRTVYERLLAPYRRCVESGRIAGGFNWMLAINNWGAVCSGNLGYVAMTMELPQEEQALYLLGTRFCMERYLASLPPDGYCSEGVGYWNYGFGHYMLFADALRRWTGGTVDLFAAPEAVRMAKFIERLELHGRRFPAFADCALNNGVKPYNELATAVFYGASSRRNSFWINDFLPQTVMGLFLLVQPDVPAVGAGKLLARDWFGDSQILVSRAGGDPALSFAAKGGHNAEQHNHNDLGSYVILLGNLLAVCDPGAEAYNQQTFSPERYRSDLLNSSGHPVPLAAGRMQSAGSAFAARVLKQDFTPERDMLVLDLRGAYEVPELEKLERTFVFDRAARRIEVADVFAFARPEAFEVALVTGEQFRIVDDRTIEFFNADYRLRLTIAAEPGPVKITAAPLTAKPLESNFRPVRIAVTLASPAAAGSIKQTFEVVQ